MNHRQNTFTSHNGLRLGPAIRGTSAQTLSAVIGDAFGGSAAVTFSGDWVKENCYDGFDRLIHSIDAVGGMVLNTFDPGGRTVATQTLGCAGGPTPADRSGSANVRLASSEAPSTKPAEFLDDLLPVEQVSACAICEGGDVVYSAVADCPEDAATEGIVDIRANLRAVAGAIHGDETVQRIERI